MPNPTTSGVDEKDDTTTSVVDDNRKKTRMEFADIVRGNHTPKSVARVNPIIPAQKKHVPQKKQVARFILAWWKLHLDRCAMYHTEFVKLLLNNVEDSDTNLVGKCNSGVTPSSFKGYYGKFHICANKNGMSKLLSITCLEEEGYHIE